MLEKQVVDWWHQKNLEDDSFLALGSFFVVIGKFSYKHKTESL